MKFEYSNEASLKPIFKAIIDNTNDIWWLNGDGLYDCPVQEMYNTRYDEIEETYGITRAFVEGDKLTITF